MGTAIGDVLPLALGIAISPIPIIAAILMLLSPRAKSTGVGFMIGWLLGVIIVIVVFTLLASVIPRGDANESRPIIGVIKIVVGVLLLLLAIRRWRGRPRDGQEPKMPKWMGAIDSMTAGRSLILGFVLAGVNPKNLLLGIAAGVAVGSGGLTVGEQVLTIAIYTVIAASTDLTPVVAYLVASEKMATPLLALRSWLVHNSATVMAVLLLVLGFVLVGKGIGSF